MNARLPGLLCAAAVLLPGAFISTSPKKMTAPMRVGIVRSVIADVAWLAADLAWERRDAAATRQCLALTVAADPGAETFWLNGARMLAFDLPVWEPKPAPWWRAYRQRLGAREALAWLERGRRVRGDSFALEVEMGNIALYGLGDRALASRSYRRAAAYSRAASYADRLARQMERPRASDRR